MRLNTATYAGGTITRSITEAAGVAAAFLEELMVEFRDHIVPVPTVLPRPSS